MDLFKLLVTIFFFLSFYLTLEVFKRRTKIHSELTRKIAHLVSGIFAIFFSNFLTKSEFLLSSFVFLVFFIIAHRNKILSSINVNHRITYGEITYPLGLIFLALTLYHEKILFITGIIIIAIPDALAGYVGFIKNEKKKSLLGSTVYFVTSSLIFLPVFNPLTSLAFAFMLTLVERVSPIGLDNLSVPIVYIFLTYLF